MTAGSVGPRGESGAHGTLLGTVFCWIAKSLCRQWLLTAPVFGVSLAPRESDPIPRAGCLGFSHVAPQSPWRLAASPCFSKTRPAPEAGQPTSQYQVLSDSTSCSSGSPWCSPSVPGRDFRTQASVLAVPHFSSGGSEPSASRAFTLLRFQGMEAGSPQSPCSPSCLQSLPTCARHPSHLMQHPPRAPVLRRLHNPADADGRAP